MKVSRMLGGALYVAATVLVAAVAAWPIYASVSFIIMVVAATLAAAAIVAVASWRRWGGWSIVGLVAAAFVVLAVPVAVPSRLTSPLDVVRGIGEAFTGAIFGWKDLVTVDLPVGAYRNLLVPALIVFLVGAVAAVLLSWREDRWANAAVAVGLGMVSFGLFFGRTSVSAPLALGPLTLPAPVETVVGVCGLGAALVWLAWRTREERVQALGRAATMSGVRMSRRPSRADRRRTALGAAMVAVALVAAVAVVPWAARGADRAVLRSAAGPEPDIAAAVSPLTQYRSLFTDDRADEVLFTVTGDASLPDRVRLATLDTYDGEIFRPGGDDGRFVRVPSTLAAGEGREVEAEVQIGALGGIWLPTVGQLSGVDFTGQRAAALADSFYYNAEAAAGVQTAGSGLEPGDVYDLRAVEPPVAELASLTAPGGDVGGVEAPDNLRSWVEEHASGTGGAALDGLVRLLRERGFLSHALTIGEEPPVWVASLPDYTFQPSASGHSLARIDTLFERLLERENDPRAQASGNYVAAIGDDEQFSVAVALIAQELGFPSRVVVGARLSSADTTLATCQDGACRGKDISAWAEVRSSDGDWVPVDVSPQWTQSPSLEVTEQRDPENVTDVRPDTVEEVVPPQPLQDDTARDDDDDDSSGLDLAWLWPVLRIAGIVLLALAVVLGPFIAIVGAKAVRRRGRRGVEDPVERIAGGWDEYIDAGVDTGRTAPREFTRSELAAAYGTPDGDVLARTADRAVFASETTTPDDAAEFWRIVDDERRSMARERGIWRRLAAAVSLRSFVRLLAPRVSRSGSSRTLERGKRRPTSGGRTTS
ncbi:transglutaminaseTgpA domain-containing protein [Microbacterium sp. P05]|uniref:transglutaminaseTgpA domain-containing protein n=1 Tax=Microbacterium sp. P05 TaxID=3366948 RepID=UPI003746C132